MTHNAQVFIFYFQNLDAPNIRHARVNMNLSSVERFSRAGPRGRGREWATLGVHPLSWLLSNNRLEEVCGTLTTGTFSSRLLLSNQDKGCTPSVAHSLALPLGPALLNLWNFFKGTNGRQKTYEVSHVYSIFYSGSCVKLP